MLESYQTVALRVTHRNGEWKTLLVTPSISLLGYDRDDFLSGRVTWRDVVHQDDLPGLSRLLSECETEGVDSFNVLYRVRLPAGGSVLVSDSTMLMRGRDGAPIYCDRIISRLDDPLTGLPGRPALEPHLSEAYQEALQYGTGGFVVFLDLDDFSDLNNSYGIEAGDQLLRRFAGRLRSELPGAAAFRYGGDQFVLVAAYPNGIYMIIEELTRWGREPWEVAGKNLYCTHSIGIAQYPDGTRTPFGVLQKADVAMHLAKKKGKDTCYFYDDLKDNSTIVRSRTEQMLRKAIDNNFEGLTMHYQPLVGTEGEVLGAEALMRWQLPDGRWISPSEFIPMAESTGLIVPLGLYALRQSTRVCSRINRTQPDFFMSVNVSPRQMQESDLVPDMMAIIAREGCVNANVYLEITEGVAMRDIELTRAVCREFRRHSIGISMDDFGTGHSALGQLRNLPLDVVKIDQIFTRNLETDPYARALVKMMVELVHTLGARLCVEGVETEGQMAFCRDNGIDYVQGFLFWRPMPEMELVRSLEQELQYA